MGTRIRRLDTTRSLKNLDDMITKENNTAFIIFHRKMQILWKKGRNILAKKFVRATRGCLCIAKKCCMFKSF